MVSCHQCSTQNSLDSAFCKRCGSPLVEADVLEAQEKVAALIAEGNVAFGEGRIEEALAISAAAIESHPNNTDALVLRSLCFERLGNISEALECAEKVVDLNPDSELDKIRRNGLRTALGNILVVPKGADRRASALLAVAAFLMVMSVSGAALYYAKQNQRVATTTPQTSDQPKGFGPVTFTPQPGQQGPVTQNPNPGGTQAQPPDTGSEGSQRPPFQPAPSGGAGTLPVSPPEVYGLIPDGSKPSTPNTNPTAGSGSGPGVDPTPDVDKPTDTRPTTPPTPTDPVADDPGTIDIKVHHGPIRGLNNSTQFVGNDTPTISRNGIEALSRTGDQQFMIGSYSAAATSFEKALSGGGNSIRLNQRLGDTYKELGRNSDAISAYSRAISACQDALQSGKGDKTAIQAALNRLQTNVKVLGG